MFKNVLLPLDLGEASSWKKALPVALDVCRNYGATLSIITVVPDFGMSVVSQYFPEDFEEKATQHTLDALHAFSRDHVPDDIPVKHVVAHGTIYEEVLAAAREIGCDLIVMSSHRPKLKDYLLGPNAARIVRHADCSVTVVRD